MWSCCPAHWLPLQLVFLSEIGGSVRGWEKGLDKSVLNEQIISNNTKKIICKTKPKHINPKAFFLLPV